MEQGTVIAARHPSLQTVITQLAESPQVAAVLTIGSLAEERFTPASDYDLVIILHDFAYTWTVGVTHIDQRFTDLLFASITALERIIALEAPVAQEHELAPVIRWLRQGQMLLDQTGQARQAQAKVQQADWLEPIADQAAYGAWFGINYNLAQAQRMVQSTDPLYRQTVAIRLAVYGHADIWYGYFTLRKLPWTGDKPAVQYLRAHDPAFLACYEQFIHTVDLDQKMILYAEVAALATAPWGGLWPPGATVINEAEARALTIFSALGVSTPS